MYFDYQTGQLIQPNQRYANPSSYLQYGTGETGINGGKANGWEQGVSDAGTGVLGAMGLGAWANLGKTAYGGLKSTNSEAGDATAHFTAPHHTTLGIFDDTLAYKNSSHKTSEQKNSIIRNGLLNMFGLGFVADIYRGKDKRAKEAGANYVNSVESPFLFALDKNGLQFAQAKAQAPESVQSNTGWLTALGGMVGSGIKSGISASQKTQSNPVAPSTQVALNDEKPTTSLAFQENTLGTKTDNEGNALVKGKNPNWNWWSTDENNNTTYPGDFNNGGNMIGLGAGQTNFGYKKGGSVQVKGGRQPIVGTKEQYQAYQDSLDLYNFSQLQHRLEPTIANWLNPLNVNNEERNRGQFELEKKAQDLVNNNPNIEWDLRRYAGTGAKFIKDSSLNPNIKKGYKMDQYYPEIWKDEIEPYYTENQSPDLAHKTIQPSGSWWGKGKNLDYKKPVQPIVYQPIISTRVGDVTGDKIAKSKDNVAVLNSRLVLKNRPKEPTSELNQEQQLLPETTTQLDFDPIRLKKGTYFTRPRQQQEEGQGNVVDYFDSKTGKLLKTMNYNKGGSVQVKGGKGNDDIALVDTNTGEDTGVRVEKDEMIIFSKKNVEALEKAVGKNKKDLVFKLVKNQMEKHGEAIEGEKHYKRGGYENLSDDELKKLYVAETEGKDFGKQDYAKFTAIEDELKKRKVDFNEWHYLNPRYTPTTFLKQALDPTRADVFGAGVEQLGKVKDAVVNYGDPIKDPEGYKKALRNRAMSVYANRHGMKFDANSRPVDLDAKKLSAIEEELKKGDLERMKKSSSTNPDDVWKGLGVEHIVKGDYLANSPFITNKTESSNSEIPTITWNGEGEDPIKKGAKLTAYNTRNSQNSTNSTTNTGTLPVVPVTKVTDPTMLDPNAVAKGLNMPYAKTINTPAEKTNNDEIYNALGYAGDAVKLGLGMQAASRKLPQWQISDNWNEYMGKLKFMSNMGLTPEQKAQYLDTADRTYQYDTANIYNLANGNAGTVLGNLGRANANRYRAGVDMAIADRSAQNVNNATYGNWLAKDEKYRKSIFDENRNQLAMTKQAGMQLASDALANMENRTDYNRFYGKGSQLEKLQNMQLEKQQYENDILKSQKENMSNPEYWKSSAFSSNKYLTDGTKGGVDLSSFTPEQLQALKTLFTKS